jgi:hypothetical protein
VYVVLLEHIDGEDLRRVMKRVGGTAVCVSEISNIDYRR